MTYDDWEADEATYKVVLNHEEQYSIWPVDRDCPNGWREEGTQGSRVECLNHIKEVWTDMRPLSLRKAMEEQAANPAPEPSEAVEVDDGPDLVTRLTEGMHPVEVVLRPTRDAQTLKASIEREFVNVRFTDTRGGTELGFKLEKASDWSAADFDSGTGTVELVGSLTLDYQPVRCIAKINLDTLTGEGRLECQ